MLIAAIADIHSDLPSLEKAIGKIRELRCDRIICLGDIVGYSYHYSGVLDGRDPNACCELVRQECHIVISGNHDLHALNKLPSYYRKLEIPENWYDLDLDEKTVLSANRFWLYDDELEHKVEPLAKQYLLNLPEIYIMRSPEFGVLCSHFIAPDHQGVSKASPASRKEFEKHFRMMKQEKCLLGIAGHAHIEGYIQVSKKYYCMNYFRKGNLLNETQIILIPAITRGESKNGFLIIDTAEKKFEAIPLG